MGFPKGATEHPVNSGKRKFLVSIWDFGAAHPQGERGYYACNDHPAKMRPALAKAILQLYGESPVLDPMAGVGTTLGEAMLLGMDAVGIEYEKKFVDQANQNIKHIQKIHSSKKLGKAVCIKGDARNLSCLNNRKVNSILTSPPYFDAIESVSTGHQGPEGGHLERQHQLAKEGKSGYEGNSNVGHIEKYGSVVFSPPYFNAIKKGDGGPHSTSNRISYSERVARFQGYSEDGGNIGNVSNFGSIIFSPPYCGVMDSKRHVGGIASRDPQLAKTGSYSKDEGNVGNIRRFGSIVFSPPYADSRVDQHNMKISTLEKACKEIGIKDFRHDLKAVRKWLDANARWGDGKYSDDKGNVGNARIYGEPFNSIVLSPPFGESNRGSGIAKRGYDGEHGKDEKLKDRCDRPLSQNKNNIGNFLYGRTYLGEMLKVYRECFRVLKPGKFMVVVVKDIQRNWKTIPLGADTIKLCQLAGFDLHDIIINKMYFPSFWMLNLAKKSQTNRRKEPHKFHVLKTHEYVLVFRKPS
jgi:DNA modification methylase